MVETGFLWALSFLGAELPQGSFKSSVSWSDEKLTVHFDQVGFTPRALEAIAQIIAHFKQSQEYKIHQSVDLGRFIALTLNASNHYYAITGIPKTFAAFKQGKVFDAKQFAVTNSLISTNDRIFDLPDSNYTDYKMNAYISNECEGKIKDGKIRTTSFEVKEQMKNGQFRFAVYDTAGYLLTAAKGEAGKPAKCVWCHESNIQPLFTDQIDAPGYYGSDFFRYIINRNILALNAYRETLRSDIDFSRKQDHTFSELLYITFMEPSAERLALEWGMTVDMVKNRVGQAATHTHREFPYLGVLYDRHEIAQFEPYSAVQPPTFAREKSAYEPDLIR